jgi:pyruvate/2-oxoglutarate dehydrogenase complex dihydrolipoamide acyltransferase (E2) component
MSFDHRMIDGAMASRVLGHVARFIADPAPAMIVG